MRKVVFTIDDIEYFKRKFKLSDEQVAEFFGEKESFKVIYTITGNGRNPDKYELTDHDGNKITLLIVFDDESDYLPEFSLYYKMMILTEDLLCINFIFGIRGILVNGFTKVNLQQKKELNEQIKNKRETTYKVIKDNKVVEYHETQGYCWRYGMVRPKPIKVEGV